MGTCKRHALRGAPSRCDLRSNSAAKSHGGPGGTYLRRPSQTPTKLATVSQIAAPQGATRSRGDLRGTYLRWTSKEPTKV
eukprot:2424145-Pyramimonas_sp.AAC.1